MILVVGLGNPGKDYAKTKHNFGFWVIDQVVQNSFLKYRSGKGDYIYAKKGNLIFAKPTTFMNNSGLAVKELCQYFNISIKNIIVIYDDIDLPLGFIRFKSSGGTGGHKGIESISYHLKSEVYNRLKLGIATDDYMRPAEKYVLKPFPNKYDNEIKSVINHASDALSFFLKEGVVMAMNKFN